MQHANILTPSGFASVWECVFIPAAWVSLWIHFTSVTERCQLVYSRLGERRGPRFYRGFCSLSDAQISLFMQQPLTGLGSVILKRSREQLPCFTVSERCLIRRVIQFIFNIWMKVCSPIWMGAVAGVKSEFMFFLPVDMMWTHNRNRHFLVWFLRHKPSPRTFC